MVPEVAQGGHAVNPGPPVPSHGVGLGGAGWGLGDVGLAKAGAARGGHPLGLGVSHKVPPPGDQGHPDAVSWGGRAFAVGAGERGALVSGDVEEGSKSKSRTPRPRVAAWMRAAPWTGWVLPEVRRCSSSWYP